jgi:hypothetical protein
MAKIFLFRLKQEKMTREKFTEIAQDLGMKVEPVETEEAIAAHDSTSALAYAQPGAKFAGLLFYTDQSTGVAEDVKKLLDEKSAKRWADSFLERFNLNSRKIEDERIKLLFETSSYQTQAITFDGKERSKTNIKTEISSKTTLNDIPVEGPRSKVRMIFKDQEKPIMMHLGLWENIEVFEERELIREHDVYTVVKEKLINRHKGGKNFDIIDIILAYYADEFRGGPDILAPYYFVEVEYEDKKAREQGISDGPRQIFTVPAYR